MDVGVVGGASAGATAGRFEACLICEIGQLAGLNHERLAIDARGVGEEAAFRWTGGA